MNIPYRALRCQTQTLAFFAISRTLAKKAGAVVGVRGGAYLGMCGRRNLKKGKFEKRRMKKYRFFFIRDALFPYVSFQFHVTG